MHNMHAMGLNSKTDLIGSSVPLKLRTNSTIQSYELTALYKSIIITVIIIIEDSMETAMLRVWSDIPAPADQKHVTLLGLLDKSAATAAIYCVDHDLLSQRLQLGFGFTGAILELI